MIRTTRIARVDPMSSARVYGAITAAFGLIIGAFVSLFAMLGAGIGDMPGPAALVFGTGAIVMLPLFYGVIGFVAGAFQAWVYNLVAVRVGGILVDLSHDEVA